MKSYLSNRKQYVNVNSNRSGLQHIICAVPQGSILGPLLFIIYINDITNTSDVLDFILFADDTTILYSHKNIASQINFINRELLEVSNWFKANKLSVNASKTNFMVLGTPQMTKYSHNVADSNDKSDVPNTSVILDGTELSHVKTTKFLGLTIDENLTWKYTISIVLWSTQRLSTFMSTQRISRHVDIIFNISTKEQWKNKMSIIT